MDDRTRVEQLLGRTPMGAFDVVVRDAAGDPVVVRNAPFLDDGTPMPTRFYLVGTDLVRAVSRLEAAGGVNRAEAEVDAVQVAEVHARYERERSSAIPDDHVGPLPHGGVGGTRTGVKCLHAHVAHQLATGDDVVGRWALDELGLDPATGRGSGAAGPSTSGDAGMPCRNTDIGGLTVAIHDRHVEIAVTGGGRHSIPVGPNTLTAQEFGRLDPPPASSLTNVLGLVHDHLDDVLVDAPTVAATPSIVFVGHHTHSLARVEIGDDAVPPGYRTRRREIDEVFRTLVAEPAADRVTNPGLDDAHVDTIIATCCVVLAFMRRLALDEAAFDPDGTDLTSLGAGGSVG